MTAPSRRAFLSVLAGGLCWWRKSGVVCDFAPGMSADFIRHYSVQADQMVTRADVLCGFANTSYGRMPMAFTDGPCAAGWIEPDGRSVYLVATDSADLERQMSAHG